MLSNKEKRGFAIFAISLVIVEAILIVLIDLSVITLIVGLVLVTGSAIGTSGWPWGWDGKVKR